MTNDSLLELKQVIEMTTLKRSTIYYMMQENQFPRPMKLGERKARWRREDVLAWLESKGITIGFNRKEYAKGYQDALKFVETILLEHQESLGKLSCNFISNLIKIR